MLFGEVTQIEREIKSVREKADPIFIMAQQITLADQLVFTKYLSVGRCNNYVVLKSIPCSPEFKIVGQILLDHPLSYALTATTDIPAMYLQQFWKTVSKVPYIKDTIKFKLDTHEIVYTVDMFRSTLKLPMETLENLFIAPRLKKEYHSIKDDTPLVSVYTAENVTVRGMMISDALLTDAIRDTDDYKEYKTVFVTIKKKKKNTTPIPPPSDDQERDDIAEVTLLSLTLHKTVVAAEAKENVVKVKERLEEEEIEKMIEGDNDELDSSDFVDSMLNENDDDDSDTRIEPESHKDNPKVVDDDDKTEKEEKKDDKTDDEEKKDDDAERKDDVEDKDDVDHTDHTLVGLKATSRIDEIYINLNCHYIQRSTTKKTYLEQVQSSSRSASQDVQAIMIYDEGFGTKMCDNWDDAFHSQHHDDHQDDDAPPEGEKREKRHKTSKQSKSAKGSSLKKLVKESISYVSKQQQQQQEWDAWVEETFVDEDKVIPEDETPELIIKFQNVNKYAEEYAYHLEQSTNFMENQIVLESRQEDIRRSKPQALVF
ncbi:hypothetical protein Tco_0351562 [Tanacetum coccineum]